MRHLTAAALAFLAVVLSACGPRRATAPHGIVVLLVDCLRFDHVGLDGGEVAVTPSIDALGPEAQVFRDAYVQASWTRPSVPSLLTGLYPSEHGLGDFVMTGEHVEGRALSPKVTTLAEGMRAAGYRTALVGYQAQLSPNFGLDQGFDFYNNNTMGAARIHKRFLDWLDEAPQKPFFAYLHYLDIHWPYCPPAETFGKFDQTPGVIDFCSNWRKLRKDIHSGAVVFTEADKRALAARYAEQVLALDAQIGQLFASLRERGAWDDTLVVLTADHGEELAERGGIEHGHTMHEELLHVPFIWKLPASWGERRGRALDGLVETRSLLPTLFALVNQQVPAEVTAPSLLPWMWGPAPATPPAAFSAAEANGMLSVRTDRWHLVFTPAAKKLELYDLQSDPRELHDVSASEPEALDQMQSLLRRWRSGLRPVGAEAMTLDQETEEGLRALGYLN